MNKYNYIQLEDYITLKSSNCIKDLTYTEISTTYEKVDKGASNYRTIYKCNNDKYYALESTTNDQMSYEDEFACYDVTLHEVFPKEKTITIYE